MVVRLPDVKKYLNRDGLEEYNSLLPHSSAEIQEYVNDWLDAHPEATTTVQDGSITTQKLADGSVTRNKLAADVAHLLGGMMVTGEVQDELITVDDAYSVAPLSMTIDGKSTQDGTPTPENPVPIQSIEVLELPVTFAGNIEPIIANIPMQGHVLRSLPDGTCDTMSLSYLRISTREGWAVYSAELVQRVGETDPSTLTWRASNGKYRAEIAGCRRGTTGKVEVLCSVLNAVATMTAGANIANNSIALRSAPYHDAWISTDTYNAGVPACVLLYPLDTPITTQLYPIELPVLPAPTCTVWSDPTTGLQMEYMRDSSIVIQRIEEAIADL